MLRIGLLENNLNLVAVLPADSFLGERLAQLQPDLVIVDAESEARDALEHVVVATRDARRPIVLFTNDEDTTHVRDAVAAGCAPTSWRGWRRSVSAPSSTWPWPALRMSKPCAPRWPTPRPSYRTAKPSIAPRACSCSARA